MAEEKAPEDSEDQDAALPDPDLAQEQPEPKNDEAPEEDAP